MGKSQDGKSPTKQQVQPQKPPGKDIRSFFSKPGGAGAGANKAAPAVKAEKPSVGTAAGGTPAAVKAEAGAPAVPPLQKKEQPAPAVKKEQPASAVKKEQPAPAAAPKPAAAARKPAAAAPKAAAAGGAKPPAKKSRVIIEDDDDDDDDDVVVMEEKEEKQKPGSGGKLAGGRRAATRAPAAKKRRVIADDDDDEVEAVSSESESDGDDEYKGDEAESSGEGDSDVEVEAEDSDVEMVDSDDDDAFEGGAGKKKKKKAAAAASQKAVKGRKATPAKMTVEPRAAGGSDGKQQLAGTKHARSATPAKVKAEPKADGGSQEGKPTPAAAKKAAGGAAKKAAGAAAGAAAAPSSRKKAAAKAVFSLNPGAQEAIAAVEAAAAKLPAEDQLNFSLIPENGEGGGNDATEPPNYQNKEPPLGHPDCLTGRTFVVSGVLDSLMRPQADDLIKRHGGKTTQAVSGKTSFLVVGHNCGRSKYRKAREMNTKLIDEDGLFALIRASEPFIPQSPPKLSPPQPASPTAAAAAGAAVTAAAARPAAAAAGPSSIPSSSFFPSAVNGGAAGSNGLVRGGAAAPAGPRTAAAPVSAGVNTQLWVDKYKPRSSAELVGNGTLVANLKSWLLAWEQVHLRGGAAPTAKGGGAKPKDLSKKAALLSGPPGIGKTSAAHIMAKEAGYEVVEMNASDTRNKAGKVKDGMAGKQSNVIKEMANNRTLPLTMFQGEAGAAGGGGAAAFGRGGGQRKQLLIMDEVDGMAGGDRGGVADLIDTIKKSKIPIICICNDRYSQKLRSLRGHCLELEFRKPTVLQISKRMSEICHKEGLAVNQATMDALVAGAGGDLRLILGQLQMVRLRSKALSFDDVRGGKMGANKDSDMSPFECSRRLLDGPSACLSMGERMELVFADIDLVPLLVQENYVNHRPSIAGDPLQRLRALAKAADSISLGDVVNNTLRRSQNWGLMPTSAVLSSILPAAYMRGSRETFGLFPGEMNFPRFTAWMGNYSTGNKQKRLLGELATTMAASGLVASNRGGVRLEYASALRHLLARPLVREQEAAVPAVVEVMHDYCIDREQLDYIMDVTSFKSKAAWAEDIFKEVPTKVKSAFTRNLNSTAPAARCLAQVEEVKLGRGKNKAKAKGKAAAGDDDEEEDVLGGDGPEGEQTAKAVVKQEPGEAAEAEEEDDDVDAGTLARRLANKGLEVQIKDEGKGAKGKKGGAGGAGGGGGRGRGAGAAAKGGRGAGRGGGKAAAKK